MKGIADIRTDYARRELNEADCLPNPVAQFELWLAEALRAEVNEPTAMVVSTLSPAGQPAARIVLLKGVDTGRLVFFTNYDSRKGQHLAQHPGIALTFFWPELERQVNIEGQVTRLSEAESDAYFASRPYKSLVGAWASPQSQVIESKNVIATRFARYAAKFLMDVPRPPHWGGFAVMPQRLELWQGRPSRLHDRILYTRDEAGQWVRSRLAP